MAGLSPVWVAVRFPLRFSIFSPLSPWRISARCMTKGQGPGRRNEEIWQEVEGKEEDRVSGSASPSTAASSPSMEEFFIHPEVQRLLRSLAGRSLERVFARQQLHQLESSEIKLLTDEELEEATAQKLKELDWHLNMPPVMSERTPCQEVLVEDPLLIDFDACRHVFMDITYGLKPRERYIVVRENDSGRLRTASWEERDKMNEIFFPIEGRHLDVPQLFQEDTLKDALHRGFHRNILDGACAQFEPDDGQFIRICQTTYDSINQTGNFAVLESTRHMGGLIFYLVSHKKLHNYLLYLLQNNRADSVVEVLRLHYLIHSGHVGDFQSALAGAKGADAPILALKYYMQSDGERESKLELALQAYQENLRQFRQESRP